MSINNKKISDLNLSERVCGCLVNAKITTLFKLRRCSKQDILDIRGLGETALYEIEDTLEELGFKKLNDIYRPKPQKPRLSDDEMIIKLPLSEWICKRLINANITTLSQLKKCSHQDILGVNGLGKSAIYKIDNVLEKFGFEKLKFTNPHFQNISRPTSCLSGLNSIDYNLMVKFLDILPEKERITVEYVCRDNKSIIWVAHSLGVSRQLIDVYLRNAVSRIGIHILNNYGSVIFNLDNVLTANSPTKTEADNSC